MSGLLDRFPQSGERIQPKAPIRSMFQEEINNGIVYSFQEAMEGIIDQIRQGAVSIDGTECADAITSGKIPRPLYYPTLPSYIFAIDSYFCLSCPLIHVFRLKF